MCKIKAVFSISYKVPFYTLVRGSVIPGVHYMSSVRTLHRQLNEDDLSLLQQTSASHNHV